MNSDKNFVRFTDISQRNAAIIAGFGLLLMAIVAPFANFFVMQRLIVQKDAAATVNNILASEGLFRTGICSFLIVIILDIVVAWALYILLKQVNKSLSLLTAWFRLVYAAIFGMALVNLFNVLQLINGADYLKSLEQAQLHIQVMLFLNAFNYGWDIGIVIFGLHLFVLGFLIFKSGFFPKFLGIFVILASFGYLIDAFGKFLLPNYNLTIAMFTFIGEVLLIFWLLWRGIKGFDKILDKKK